MNAPQAAPPEPLPVAAFDAHAHLDMLSKPVAEVLADAAAAGITRVVTVGCDVESSLWAAAQAAGHVGVYAAVAIHPNETARAEARPGTATGRPDPGSSGSGAGGDAGAAGSGGADGHASAPAGREAVLAEIVRLTGQPRVRAVGETGLDYYRDSAPPGLQRDWFRAHIEIAKSAGKALMIHDRDAHDDVLAILDEHGAPEHVVFHCFSGDAELAKRCAERGYVMSFAGNVTFPSAGNLREAAAFAPAELILVETDAPFLTPIPNRGRQNAPAQVAHTLRAIAAIKRTDVAELCAVVTANGARVFGGWDE